MKELPKTDAQRYQYAIDKLTDHLEEILNSDGVVIIVALSRKGPRLLEKIMSGKTFKHQPVIVTEHALPFLFKNLVDLKEEKVRMYILDDAVYFGSTLEGIYQEMLRYEDFFHLNIPLKALAAIRAKEAKELKGLSILAEPVNNGYGYYFVKRLMANIRTSHMPLEIDFPCVKFKLDQKIDTDKLWLCLKKAYPDQAYQVEHPETVSYNVLLNADSGSYFNKMRFYPDGDKLYVEPMTPRVVINDDEQMRLLFDDATEDIADFWDDIFSEYSFTSNFYPKELSRSVRKTFVTLANYIYSFNTLILQYNTLRQVVKEIGCEIQEVSLNWLDLKYILFHNKLAHDLHHILTDHLVNCTPLLKAYGISLINFSRQQIFESYDYPTKEERDILQSHDSQMIYNSANITQALSAIFFNQNLLIERWSRKMVSLGRTRLYFGYTFQSLAKLLSEYCHHFTVKEDDCLKIHAWIDKRIEQGCIVPQYVCDVTNNVWTRVFRPGENEDSILSHIGRWVCWVLTELQKKTEVPRVHRKLLNEVLYYLISRVDGLGKELGIQMVLRDKKRELLFIDDSGEVEHVVDYLEKMNILHRVDQYEYVPPYLMEDDFCLQNTLSIEINEIQRHTIQQIADDFRRFRVSSATPYLVFNYYFLDRFNNSDAQQAIIALAQTLNDQIVLLREKIRSGAKDLIPAENRNIIFKSYAGIIPYTTTLAIVWGENKVDNIENKTPGLVETERRIYQLNLIISYLMAIFADKDIEQVRRLVYISDSYYEYMAATEIKREALVMVQQKSLRKALSDVNFTFKLQSVINNSVLND